MKLDTLNNLPRGAFVDALGSVFEHSPWVVETAARDRPFVNCKALQAACESALYGAGAAAQGALIRAHPDLAAKLDRLSELTEFSRREQDRAGFLRLDADVLASLRTHLREYRERFGHPFILCVTEHPAGDVLPILKVRKRARAEAEHLACLFQIARIGWHRICGLVEENANEERI